MGLVERLKLMLKADAHGAIDALQEPALLLKQHLREAEAALADKRAALARLGDEQTRLGSSRDRVVIEMARHDKDVTLAVDEGRDDLARQAIARVMSLQQLQARLSERLSEVAAERAALTSTVETQEAELQVLRTRVRTHLERLELGGDGGTALEDAARCPSPTPDQVEMELLRRKRGVQPPSPSSVGEGHGGVPS